MLNSHMRHIYVHVPFCDGKCSYCGFYSKIGSDAEIGSYLRCLEKEMDLVFGGNGCATPETVYFGGGTPSILGSAHLERLCSLLLNRISTSELVEWTIEANPGTLTAGKLRVLKNAGVNRVSIGVQSLDDDVLRQIGRRHNAADLASTVDLLRSHGMDNISLDLIAGLPGVDSAKWRQTLKRTVAFQPAHLSVYALNIEHGSEFGRRVLAGDLKPPDDDSVIEALDETEQILEPAGYAHYETSNYALPSRECRHNLAYWRGKDYIGFGPAASSRIGLKRWTNVPDFGGYLAALDRDHLPPREEEVVSPKTDAAERLMFAFRLSEGVDIRAFSTDEKLLSEWNSTLTKLAAEELVEQRGARWVPTKLGRLMADRIAAGFV
jgi:oxygen-independent coproporphyrinogen-3 oxidase